jgi:hypothetical protein
MFKQILVKQSIILKSCKEGKHPHVLILVKNIQNVMVVMDETIATFQ